MSATGLLFGQDDQAPLLPRSISIVKKAYGTCPDYTCGIVAKALLKKLASFPGLNRVVRPTPVRSRFNMAARLC